MVPVFYVLLLSSFKKDQQYVAEIWANNIIILQLNEGSISIIIIINAESLYHIQYRPKI